MNELMLHIIAETHGKVSFLTFLKDRKPLCKLRRGARQEVVRGVAQREDTNRLVGRGLVYLAHRIFIDEVAHERGSRMCLNPGALAGADCDACGCERNQEAGVLCSFTGLRT